MSGGISINWLNAKIKNFHAGKKLSSFPKGYTIEVSKLTGRGVLFPSEAFRYGLYNDRHYKQCEDTEFPRRLQKEGYKLIVAYDVPVFRYSSSKKHINTIQNYKISDLYKYFWNIRSNQNLRYRFWFAYDCATSFLTGTLYFVCDFARIAWHFLVRLQ